MSVEKLLHEPKRCLSVSAVFETVEEGDAPEDVAMHTGSTLTWYHDSTPLAGGQPGDADSDCMEQEEEGSDSGSNSPGFVLKRGNITPDHLLPEVGSNPAIAD